MSPLTVRGMVAGRDHDDCSLRFSADPNRGEVLLRPAAVLANLFGVEMWERFSFYGMQGILLIYLYYSAARGGLGLDEA